VRAMPMCGTCPPMRWVNSSIRRPCCDRSVRTSDVIRTRSCSLLRPLWRLRQMMNRYRRSARSPRNALGYGFRVARGRFDRHSPGDRRSPASTAGARLRPDRVCSPRPRIDETLDLLASQVIASSSSSAVRARARAGRSCCGRPRGCHRRYRSAPPTKDVLGSPVGDGAMRIHRQGSDAP